VLQPCQPAKLARGAKDKEHGMYQKLNTAITAIGIDIGKNSRSRRFTTSATSADSPQRQIGDLRLSRALR
jgi:hypothetical protein